MGDLLGRGGMAEVFAGHSVGDHGFQKPVAIKRLLPELANDEVFVDRLIEEAKLLVGMQHGNIVSVLDLAREGDDVFLVMEYVDGPSLRQLIKARGALGLSLGVTTYIVQSAAAGLEFAHVRPGGAIIHADISPSNLLLTTSGEVRVADFGIARREGLGEGIVEGKWAYMAPEQARGEALTPRSDVFALGVVLYELLTGEHPFGRAVTASQRDDQMRVIPPRVIRPSLPLGLEAICMRALAHDPRDRYARMQQLIDALVDERFASGYREGASDLAQAIREVAQGSDMGAPRTMHTERPITIVTRSLLREITPVRESTPPRRPSYPDQPLGPHDPPPRDAFPMQPTVGVQTMVRLPESSRSSELPPDEYTMLPGSGAHTTARAVDQVALAQAAAAAAAMHEVPSILRTDGTPMPPFRMPDGVLGDELASVVGGHTFTSHGAVAVENRSSRWTIAVLAAAAMIGVVAGVAIQISPANAADPAPAVALTPGEAEAQAAQPPAAEPAPMVVEQAAVEAAAGEALPEAAPVEALPVAAPPEVAPPAVAPPEAAPALAAPPITEAAPITEVTPPAPQATPPAIEATPPTVEATALNVVAPAAAPSVVRDRRKPVGSRSAESRSAPRRSAKDKTRNDPGILSVQAAPWAWVTVGNQKKETPDKFYLAPGTYVVKFYNPDSGVTKYDNVVIEAGKLEKLDKSMDH